MSELSQSEINKWRCLVALAHADGKITMEEMKLLKSHFREQGFSPSMTNQLNQDLANPQGFKELYKGVTEKEHRHELLALAHSLFWADSDFDEAEQRLYEYIEGSLQV